MSKGKGLAKGTYCIRPDYKWHIRSPKGRVPFSGGLERTLVGTWVLCCMGLIYYLLVYLAQSLRKTIPSPIACDLHGYEADLILLFPPYCLENAWHCRASLTEYTHRTWSRYLHFTVIRMWLNLRPQKSHKLIHTCEKMNCESGLVIIYKHAAHRLVKHRMQVMQMTWTDDSTLAIFFYIHYR